MRKGILNIKVDYKPLDAFKNVVVRSGSNRQNYNANTRYFEPDRRIDPYVVLIECGVNDTHGIVSGLVNANLTDVVWKQSTSTGYKTIEASDKEFRIGTGADKGKITIFKNVSDTEPVTILFTARFIDNTTKRVVNFQESFNLVTLPVALAPILIETQAPVGYNLFPTENNQGLICQADLYQGTEKLPAAYWWYKGNTQLTESNGYSGTAKNKLFVPADVISKTGDVFKCEVADCSEYFNGLVQQKVEADPEVIEWRTLYQQSLVDGSVNLMAYSDIVGVNSTYVNPLSKPSSKAFSKGQRLILSCEVKFTEISILTQNRVGCEFSIRYNDLRGQNLIMYVGAWRDGLNQGDSFDGVVVAGRTVPEDFKEVTHINAIVLYAGFVKSKVGDVSVSKPKLEIGTSSSPWSPSVEDLQDLVVKKTEYYKTQTTLPENYRPDPKPTKLWTADFMLMKKFPEYYEEVLYPTSVSPESTSVQVEMVLNTNDGIIQQPERFFSVGWLKQANGTYKYKGFKIKISIADIKALNDANKQLDYELREDLTLKP